ncbi:MAG: RdgB/HAM1 family non-canonical purine NTP pyrophosphatase [Planctomycetota bacterium]|nr:MAG: RdgB/HAM1 family non-canonical purine NTP pyrophosphatase [Planctomycetota bacterium]
MTLGPSTLHRGGHLVLGTTNAGKVRELTILLAPHQIAVRSLAESPGAVAVAETGTTFAENAALKATQQAKALGSWVLAEDSGLVVDALGGAPGIHSARFATDDSSNNALLLERLAGVPAGSRTAHYACHAALADPEGRIVAESSGVCCGLIANGYAGEGGFGYDPLFVVPEYHRTFGELSPEVKALISHRARAMRSLLPAILLHAGAPSVAR